MVKNKFPTFGVVLLLLGIVWLLKELEILRINFPLIPSIIIIIALGMIVNKITRNR